MERRGQTITGVVTNKTNSKASAGDDVVLLKLAQGMQELARAKTDGKGRFTIKVPAGEAESLHMIRVTHDKANYFRPVQPGAQSVEVEVYQAAPQVEGVTLDRRRNAGADRAWWAESAHRGTFSCKECSRRRRRRCLASIRLS